jgi:antitoxin YefM
MKGLKSNLEGQFWCLSSRKSKNNSLGWLKEAKKMKSVTIETLSKNLATILSDIMTQDGILRIKTEKGNAILLSESRYNSLIESLSLLLEPGLYTSVKKRNERTHRKRQVDRRNENLCHHR